MKPVALVGHQHECPLHGSGIVVSGSKTYQFNDKAVACIGDRTSCGAIIIEGSMNYQINGKPVARQGDHTDHGGVLIVGDTGWLLE
ncbi:PAAR domain-containing protein [Pseudomonas sp. NY15372]|uniref:PAAR domain-containing protein n=1 Tax=Pseudomonas sp. NY15372 TaxID=3400356 RepID=UPI003A8954D0